MKFKIAVCLLVSLRLFSSQQDQFESSTLVAAMPNTLAIISILTNNAGVENCFCDTARSIEIAETLAGLRMTREELVTSLHKLTQDKDPIKPDPACYAKAAALMALAQSRI